MKVLNLPVSPTIFYCILNEALRLNFNCAKLCYWYSTSQGLKEFYLLKFNSCWKYVKWVKNVLKMWIVVHKLWYSEYFFSMKKYNIEGNVFSMLYITLEYCLGLKYLEFRFNLKYRPLVCVELWKYKLPM